MYKRQEVLEKGILDFRISHKFGDLAGDNGGFHSLYGFDNVSDIRIAFEYGYSDKLMLALGRSKGVINTELFDGLIKYKIMTQSKKNPLSMSFLSSVYVTTIQKSSIENTLNNYNNFKERFSYFHQLIMASKLSERIIVSVAPFYNFRQLVFDTDRNNLFGLTFGGRIRTSKTLAILFDYNYVTNQKDRKFTTNSSQNAWGIGLEIDTGSHTFYLNLSNSKGVVENEFIPYTSSKTMDGQFRLGFTISRPFKLHQKRF